LLDLPDAIRYSNMIPQDKSNYKSYAQMSGERKESSNGTHIRSSGNNQQEQFLSTPIIEEEGKSSGDGS